MQFCMFWFEIKVKKKKSIKMQTDAGSYDTDIHTLTYTHTLTQSMLAKLIVKTQLCPSQESPETNKTEKTLERGDQC